MASLFEGYERRIDQINAVLNSYGISSIEEAEKITKDAGLNVYDQVKKIQPICFENACWAYTVGAAIAIKKGCKRAADAAAAIGEGLQAFCIPGSVADHRKVGLGHGNLGKMLLEEETECFCFLAGHESFAAAEGAIGIAEKANKVRQKPLRVILNGLGKDAAQIISRINGFTFVETKYDYKAAKLNIEYEKAYSDGLRATVKCYGADDVQEGVAIMHHENVGVSITGNSTNPTRFQHPVAGTYKKECIEQGKKYFSVASGGGTGRTLHPDNMAAGPASYGMTDTMGRMHSDAQFAGSSSVPAHVEMMGLIGAGNNPMVGMTVAVAVSVQEAADAGKFDTAVVVKPTVGKVTSVSSASIVAGGKTYKFADDNIVDGLKKDDYAVVVPNLFNDNNDITKADIVEGAYNGVKSHEVRVASNWYKTSEATATLMSGISSGNTVQLFVANGVAFDAKKITGTGSGEPDMALVVDTGSFKQVRVMFADGTVKTVDVDGTNPTAGTLYEYTVKEGKYKFVTPTGNVDYTYVSSAVLNQADGTTAADTTHSVEKFGTNAIDDNAVVFVYSANETDAKKITGKQLKTMKVGSGALVGTAVGYTSKVNGMTKATYVAVKMATGTNLPNNFDTNDNYGYIVKDAYKDGDYSVYKVWIGTETVEVREEVTYNSTETHKDARLKGDVIGYSAIETKEGELPEIKDVTRYSLAVAGTTLKVGGVSGSTSSKVAIDGANEYDLTKDTVILNVNSSEDTKDIGLTGTELFEADDYTVGSATKYVPNALYLLDGNDIEMIVVDANVIKNTYAAKVASIATGVTVEDRNGDAVEAGDYVVANEVLTVK